MPTLRGWQITPFYKPAREVGGDFYDFLELDDGRLGIVVGDATGKGVPAALVMASARSMLTALAQIYCTLDPESGRLIYANAGHDMPYLRRRSGDAEELRARGCL